MQLLDGWRQTTITQSKKPATAILWGAQQAKPTPMLVTNGKQLFVPVTSNSAPSRNHQHLLIRTHDTIQNATRNHATTAAATATTSIQPGPRSPANNNSSSSHHSQRSALFFRTIHNHNDLYSHLSSSRSVAPRTSDCLTSCVCI